MWNEDGTYNKAECLKCSEQCRSHGFFDQCAYGCGFTPEAEEKCTGSNCSAYRGTQNETSTGKKCQSWAVDVPHNRGMHTNELMPGQGLGSHSYCRNPNGKKKQLWCFTMDKKTEWEYCTPKRDGNKERLFKCEAQAEQCANADCRDYKGQQSKTRSGKTCQAWSVDAPHVKDAKHNPAKDPNLQGNYCRNSLDEKWTKQKGSCRDKDSKYTDAQLKMDVNHSTRQSCMTSC